MTQKKLSIFAKLQFFLVRFKFGGIKRKYKTEKSSLGYWKKGPRILICIFHSFRVLTGSSHANDQSWILTLLISFNGLQYGFFFCLKWTKILSVFFRLFWFDVNQTSNSCLVVKASWKIKNSRLAAGKSQLNFYLIFF